MQKVIYPDSTLTLQGDKNNLEIKGKGAVKIRIGMCGLTEYFRVLNYTHIYLIRVILFRGENIIFPVHYKLYDEKWRIKGEGPSVPAGGYDKGHRTNVELIVKRNGELQFRGLY